MSQENVEVVERAIAAVNDRDIDSYLACCTKDVQPQTPVTPIEGVYEGRKELGGSSPMCSMQARISGSRSNTWSPSALTGFSASCAST